MKTFSFSKEFYFRFKNTFALQMIYKWKRFHFKNIFKMETFSFMNHLHRESIFETKVKFFSKRKCFHLQIICNKKIFLKRICFHLCIICIFFVKKKCRKKKMLGWHAWTTIVKCVWKCFSKFSIFWKCFSKCHSVFTQS